MRHLLFNCLIAVFSIAILSSCKDNNEVPSNANNPIAYIKDAAKLDMLRSMEDLDGKGRFYEINYTADYKLNQVLGCNLTKTEELFSYIAYILYDSIPSTKTGVNFGAGCSAFAVKNGSESLMGRNYDFRHVKNNAYVPTSAILVHTAPEGGKRSISMVDGLNLNYGQGFYNDGKTDLSLLMGLPYAALDGINEDGFAIGILALNETQTKQQSGKPKISSTVAIRMLLDRASSVAEALKMLEDYDMDMEGQGKSNYHFFMADARGDYAIIEYTFDKNRGESVPHVREVLSGNDTLRCVTNFYVSPTMVGTNDGWGSEHGKWRYDSLRVNLSAAKYSLSEDSAMKLLETVSQPPTEEITSQTQWSALYNLSQKSVRLAILREYGKQYDFKVNP